MSNPLWTLESALKLIRSVEPTLKENHHCFLALCGGVLRKGESDKDLDLILVPMNGDVQPDLDGAKKYLDSIWGKREHEGITGFDQTYLPLNFSQWRELRIDLITII